jgi:hypothetical protein
MFGPASATVLLSQAKMRQRSEMTATGRLRQPGYVLTTFAVFIFAILSACSMATTGNAANDAAAVDALNAWWKDATYSKPPVKAGTVTPTQTITSPNGRVQTIPRHVQTRQEAEAEVEDARWAQHLRAIVRGFSVGDGTVTVLTSLTGAEAPHPSSDLPGAVLESDAQELCHILGGFVWANDNRRFGLENILIKGADGQVLSHRIGIRGKVR